MSLFNTYILSNTLSSFDIPWYVESSRTCWREVPFLRNSLCVWCAEKFGAGRLRVVGVLKAVNSTCSSMVYGVCSCVLSRVDMGNLYEM